MLHKLLLSLFFCFSSTSSCLWTSYECWPQKFERQTQGDMTPGSSTGLYSTDCIYRTSGSLYAGVWRKLCAADLSDLSPWSLILNVNIADRSTLLLSLTSPSEQENVNYTNILCSYNVIVLLLLLRSSGVTRICLFHSLPDDCCVHNVIVYQLKERERKRFSCLAWTKNVHNHPDVL